MDCSELEAMRPHLASFLAARVRDPEDLADVTQETLLTAWEVWDRCRQPESRRAWLFGIALNCLRHQWRQQKKRAGQVPLEDAETVPDGQTPETVCLPRLEVPLHWLPPADRELLILFAEGFTCAELACLEGGTVAAVKSRLYRVRTRLRRGMVAA